MIIYCDGGSRGNPGPAASAFVATQDDSILEKRSKYLGLTTNNVAEYTAVIMALQWILESQLNGEIIFNLDSQLIERQINGFYKVKDSKLIALHNEVKLLIQRMEEKPRFLWNYRSGNTLADSLVNEELDKNNNH